MVKKMGFAPVYSENSKILILGSFPSVKSREINFYYGNKQNRFWRTVCSFFNEEIPLNVEGKKDFLLRRNIALWDIVTECEIEGSSDATIKNYKIAPLNEILSRANIKLIILNGATAYNIFKEHYGDIAIPYKKLTSTSPANPRFNLNEWQEALNELL